MLQGRQVARGLGMVELSPRTQGRHGPKLQAERKKSEGKSATAAPAGDAAWEKERGEPGLILAE
jgi:hypothetical protein